MADRRIGHQPLDVALTDCGERAEQHRGEGDERDDLLPLRSDAGKGGDGSAHEHGDAGHFRRRGEKRRDRRRRAFIDVRCPHMKRNRRNLEAEAREQKDEAENQSAAGVRGRLRDTGKTHGAGEAIDQRGAVEQHSRRQRPKHEIFEARFRRPQRRAMARGHHVERQAHQFEAEIERDQVGGRDQHQHAERRQHDQHGIFEPLLAGALVVIDRHQDRGGRAGNSQDFQKAGEVVDHEAAVESDKLAFGQQQHDDAGDHQQHDRGDVDQDQGAFAAEDAEHQQRHGADAEHDFGQQRDEAGHGHNRVHHLTSSAPPLARLRPHAGSCRSAASPKRPKYRVPAWDRCRTRWSGSPAAPGSPSRASRYP